MVLRGRLVERLRARFEHRLTVIEAGAGFGKSTLLSQAIHENRIEQLGIDVLLRVAETDRRPAHLLEGLATALGVRESEATVERVVDAVWARAPASVAVILDDGHRLGDADAAWGLLGQLLEQLPSNGHLVVSGRTAPRLPVARLLEQGDALVISEADLALDDAELTEVASLRSIAPSVAAELPRWPALATLIGAVGRSASIEYLWDEVLEAIPGDRRRLLAAAVPFGEIDDELLRTLGGTTTAAQLVHGVPLVDALDGGSFRLHDLWAGALAPAIGADDRTVALRAGGSMLLARGELGRAAEAFALAGDEAGLAEVVLAIARQPTIAADLAEVDRVHGSLPEPMRRGAGARFLEATRSFAIDHSQAAVFFDQAAAQARASGEVELELLSIWRGVQIADLDRPGGPPISDRVIELAERGEDLAIAIRAFIESRQRQRDGDPDGAIEALARFEGFGPEQQAVSTALRYVDLGRPEALDATVESVLTSGVSDVYAAQAVWLQGLIDPRLAWPLARELPRRAESIPLPTATALRSVVVTMGVAAGAHDEVVSLAETTVREARATVRVNQRFAHVAAALVELVVDGEDAAVASLARLLDEVPVGRWPERPYLYALAVIRGLLPGGDALDGCRFGPSLSVAVEAGAALAALRAGDAEPAAALPWSSPVLLRVHVPPPLLAELALAAGDAPGASAVLADLPHLRTWLRRIADRPTSSSVVGRRVAELASARSQHLPARPAYDLAIDLLGGLAVRRSDRVPLEGWDRRERVRHLLAFVALGRDVARADAAAALWPELSPEKAAANLRVNLHHLQRSLQPDRGEEPPWFVQADAERLRLAGEGVTVDVELVDAAMAEAARAEAAGRPSEALVQYERVAALATGDLLPEVPADWAVLERDRLRSIVHAAAARQGELVLARGEPEAAMAIAARALRLHPLDERVHRVSIRCHLALGSTSAARAAASHLRAIFGEAGLELDRETEALLARFGG
jgi:DNA-binding SARP family transcriptional activator